MIKHMIQITGLLLSVTLLLACSNVLNIQSTLSEKEVENEIIHLVNKERLDEGLQPLTRDNNLDNYAQQYAASQFSRDLMEHIDLKYLVNNSWRVTYDNSRAKLTKDTPKEQITYCLSEPSFLINMLREDATATGIGVSVIGNTVYFTQVFDVLNTTVGNGDPVKLYDNELAKNPSWDQLKTFISNDNTDENTYIAGSFVCVDFAVMLHNKAEAAGIRTAYVSISFLEDIPGHALNAFQTTNRGLVYIDCVGPGLLDIKTEDNVSINSITCYDKVAYIDKFQEYGLIPVEYAGSFTYDFYENWQNKWEDWEDNKASYDEQLKTYGELVNGTYIISDPAQYERLKAWEDELNDSMKELGRIRWTSPGIVSDYYIHW